MCLVAIEIVYKKEIVIVRVNPRTLLISTITDKNQILIIHLLQSVHLDQQMSLRCLLQSTLIIGRLRDENDEE